MNEPANAVTLDTLPEARSSGKRRRSLPIPACPCAATAWSRSAWPVFWMPHRQGSIRRPNATDGARRAPSPLIPTPHVIPAKAGIYPSAPRSAPCPSFPRRRESRPLRAPQRPDPPLPTRGEDAANAAGEGTADEARNAPHNRHSPLYRHSGVGRNPFGAIAPQTGHKAPSPRSPRGHVIPAKAGTYWRPP